VGDKPFHVS